MSVDRWDELGVDPLVLDNDVLAALYETIGDKNHEDLLEEQKQRIRTSIRGMTPRRVLRLWLEYEGIIGYTDKLIRVFETLRPSDGR